MKRCEIPAAWAHEASCRGLGALFVVPDGAATSFSPQVRDQAEIARAICAQCQVLGACRSWALSRPDPAAGMIAGGLTPAERRRQRARQARTAVTVATRAEDVEPSAVGAAAAPGDGTVEDDEGVRAREEG